MFELNKLIYLIRCNLYKLMVSMSKLDKGILVLIIYTKENLYYSKF